MSYFSDDDEVSSGQINYDSITKSLEGSNPIPIENPINSGNIDTNSQPSKKIETEIEDNKVESPQEKQDELEPSLFDINKDGVVNYKDAIAGIRKPFTNLKNSLDRDGDGEATMTDLAGYGKDGVIGLGETFRGASGLDNHINTILYGAIGLGFVYIFLNKK